MLYSVSDRQPYCFEQSLLRAVMIFWTTNALVGSEKDPIFMDIAQGGNVSRNGGRNGIRNTSKQEEGL